MTGSPIFSVNLTNQRNPANLNYHMSIKKSQVRPSNALQISSLAFGLRWAQKTKPYFVTLGTFFSFLFPLSSFLFPLSSFLFPLSPFLFPRSSWRSFSVLKILTVSRPEKSSKCHKTWFRFLSPQRKPNAKLEAYKAFQRFDFS